MTTAVRPEMPERLGGAPHSKQSLRLWLRMLTCTSIIEKRIRNRLRAEFGTTLPRFDVLAALDHAGGPLTMSELSKHLMVSNGNITGIVSRLEGDGLVKREGSPRDRRTVYVALTKTGQREFNQQARHHEGWLDRMMAELSDTEIAELLDGLGELRHSVEAATTGERK